ncbi:HET-domain-containing protein [Tothia fuscella]|uniref:HET-domain-containing protein n=1 Tax=Tothia fuscella TaxID=1048955 RepID=A0A9P4NUI4_9PEZI|nr:HET-domain-containing protein [Tothia fuscella]
MQTSCSKPKAITLTSHSCRHCETLLLQTVAEWTWNWAPLRKYGTVEEMMKANRECPFIRLTLAKWQTDIGKYESRLQSRKFRAGVKLLSWIHCSKRYASLPLDLMVNIKYDWNGRVDTMWGVEFEWFMRDHSRGMEVEWFNRDLSRGIESFHVYAEDDATSGSLLRSRPVNPDPSSEGTFSLARQWLNEYDKLDEHSAVSPSTQCPASRLLDVSETSLDGTPHVRLFAPYCNQQYAALSYVWGSNSEHDQPHFYSTRIETLERGIAGITFNSLPLTIRDAVTVTRNLSIRYLWVDRLCIVQDDMDDKRKELGKMHEIYGFAYVTISAASAQHCDSGFLGAKVDLTVEEAKARLSYKHPENLIHRSVSPEIVNRQNSIILQRFKPGCGSKTQLSEPIMTRAWTMQEHLLSRKVLVFGSRQVRWISDRSDSQLTDGGPQSPDTLLPYPFLEVRKGRPFNTPAWYDRGLPTKYSWDAIIAEYSKRQVSRPLDKLTALGGLASRFAQLMKFPTDAYLGGLWKVDLVQQLLWTPLLEDVKSRPEEYRAPTWSWASLDSAVNPNGFRIDECVYDFYDDYSVAPRILIAQCDPVSQLNPFGAIKSGRIVCQGYMRQAALVQEGDNHMLTWYTSRVAPRAYLDTLYTEKALQEERMSQLFCLVRESSNGKACGSLT